MRYLRSRGAGSTTSSGRSRRSRLLVRLRRLVRFAIKPRTREGAAALLALAATVGLAVAGIWPFNGDPVTESEVKSPSLLQFIVGDRIMLGMIRLLLLARSAFAIASLAAFLSRGRWLKGLSGKGWAVDEREESSEAIKDLEGQVRRLMWERDTAIREWDALLEEGQQTIEEAEEGVDRQRYNA